MSVQLDEVKELKTAVVTVIIRNELHLPILGSALLTLTLTLYDQRSGALINRPLRQNILGITTPSPLRINGGLIDETGELDLRLEPDDNPILGTSRVETHVLFLEWTWMDDGVVKYGGEELLLPVTNFSKLPV